MKTTRTRGIGPKTRAAAAERSRRASGTTRVYALGPGASIEFTPGAVEGHPGPDDLERGIPLERKEVFTYGKWHAQPRSVCLMGDDGVKYKYSGAEYAAAAWTAPVLEIKARVESITGDRYNSCLVNSYKDGMDHVSWHSDNEKGLDQTSIASVSVGATRDFQIRAKDDHSDKTNFELRDGDLLVMRNAQKSWEHALPKRRKVAGKRINLTFRAIAPANK